MAYANQSRLSPNHHRSLPDQSREQRRDRGYSSRARLCPSVWDAVFEDIYERHLSYGLREEEMFHFDGMYDSDDAYYNRSTQNEVSRTSHVVEPTRRLETLLGPEATGSTSESLVNSGGAREDELYGREAEARTSPRGATQASSRFDGLRDAFAAAMYDIRGWCDRGFQQAVHLRTSSGTTGGQGADIPPPPYTKRDPQRSEAEALGVLFDNGREDLAPWFFRCLSAETARREAEQLPPYTEVDPMKERPRYTIAMMDSSTQTD